MKQLRPTRDVCVFACVYVQACLGLCVRLCLSIYFICLHVLQVQY